jgi:hypothetical protein
VAENKREIGFESFKKSLYLLFKIDETPSTEFHDKELVEERICLALRLDYPNEVKMIMQGFQIPFHAKDGQKHSPEKQLQPKIKKKTVDLTDRQKEALH